MKTGKPLTFAEIVRESTKDTAGNKILAFGLPGNPVSCLVCFHLFVIPAIQHLSGYAEPHLPRVHARSKQVIKVDRVRPKFHRATIRWEINDGTGIPGFVVESTGQQVSSCLLGMKSANALSELPPIGNLILTGTPVVAITVAEIIGFSRTTSCPH